VLLTTAVGLLCYLVSYQFIFKYQSADLKGPASSLFRVSQVFSLSDHFQGSVGVKPHLDENAFRMLEAMGS